MDRESVKDLFLLTADNFTPLARTPWAGKDIGDSFKPGHQGLLVGEAWEFSCDPELPSRILHKGKAGWTLGQLIKAFPAETLSKEQLAKTGSSCELLVKLINAKSPLSLQVHPEDKDTHLAEGECGKPESWLVLSAKKGAGLYLGFSQKMTKKELAALLRAGKDIKPFLQFVPVKAGDFFEIKPGVPHAIGDGVTLLEPQRIKEGQSGKTYRLWDWQRLYDDAGHLDMENGSPRPLHIEAGLKLIDPQTQVGEGFVDSLRVTPKIEKVGNSKVSVYPANDYYQVICLSMPKENAHKLVIERGYASLIPLKGGFMPEGHLAEKGFVPKGQPCFLPASLGELSFKTLKEDLYMAVIVPQGAQFSFY